MLALALSPLSESHPNPAEPTQRPRNLHCRSRHIIRPSQTPGPGQIDKLQGNLRRNRQRRTADSGFPGRGCRKGSRCIRCKGRDEERGQRGIGARSLPQELAAQLPG